MIKKMSLAPAALLFGLFLANCSTSDNYLEPPSSPSSQVGVSSSSSDDTPLSSSSDNTSSSSESVDILNPSQENILTLLRDNRLYLGLGYDVIHSSYINREDVKRTFPVLDRKKMIYDELIVSKQIPGQQVFQTFTGTSRAEFYENINESINAGSNAKIPFKGVLFSGKFSTEFKLLQNDNRIHTSMYLRGRSYRYTQDEYIEKPTAEKLVKYLDEDFAANLTSGNANQILDRYGSHVLIQYNKGGAMEFNYAYYGSELKSNTQLSGALNASLSARVLGFGGGVSGGVTGGTSNSKNELESKSEFNSLVYGGVAINASSWEQIESNYGTWLNSIADNADICGIGRFDQSFIPIWELAEAGGEAELAKELKAEFDRRATEQGKALLTKKSVTEIKEFTDSSVYTFNKSFPATVEIYALGAGGGGQGGHRMAAGVGKHYNGSGAAGGGGAAVYYKTTINSSSSFKITIGKGGTGGEGFRESGIGKWNSGYPGTDGGSTSVTWNNGSSNIIANGGKLGGGGNRYQGLDAGSGGRASNCEGCTSVAGEAGTGGERGYSVDASKLASRGGNSGTVRIEGGSVNPFGNGLGAERQNSDVITRYAGYGGGGFGGYKHTQFGSNGGNGKVVIAVTYFE